MREDIVKIFPVVDELVGDINMESFEATNEEFTPLCYESNGISLCIYFMNSLVWDSSEDDWDDNDLISLKNELRKLIIEKMNEITTNIQKIVNLPILKEE